MQWHKTECACRGTLVKLFKISKLLSISGFSVLFITAALNVSLAAEGEISLPKEMPAEVAQPVKAETSTLLGPNDFKDLLENSPFTRTLNISEVFSLTGVAQIGGKPVLTLLNRTTKETTMVSDEPNEDGWRIMEIYPSIELGKVEAKISAGAGQVVSVRFDEKQLNPENNGAGKRPPQQNQGRPPQGGGERRGPDPKIMEKYRSLSQEQQQRFREIMREQWMKNRNMSPEERQQMTARALEEVTRGGRGR